MMGGLDGGRRLMEGEVSKARNVGETLRRFWRYFRRYWYGVAAALTLIVIATWSQVVAPDIIGQAVDCYLFPRPAVSFGNFSQPGTTCWYDANVQAAIANNTLDTITTEARLNGLAGMTLILIGLFVLGAISNGLAFFAMSRTGQLVLRLIRSDLFAKLQHLTIGFYARNEAGNLMSRVTSDTDTIQQVFSFALLSVIGGALLIVWIIIKMLQTNISYALISLTVVPLMFIATVYFSGQARRAFRRSRQEMGSVNANLQESIAGVREVQAFNREEESIEEFRRTNAANRAANIRAASFTSALTPVLEALGYVALAIVVVVGGLAVLRDQPLPGGGVVTLGIVFAFLQYVQRFNQPIQQIAVLWTNIQSAIAGGERIFNLLDTPVEIVDKPDAIAMPPIVGRVEFKEVWAEYKPGQPVLKDVTFTAEPGQTIAIVGPTGAGKTTIINLIPRFYDVSAGSVTIDGIDVRDVTLASLREQIGVVLQDTFLFSDTVMNNIRYGNLNASDDEVIAAARLAAADRFIEKLSDGYKTMLGERGAGLSQGQRQLISIARVALKNPRILILDEATSSVDTRTERLIQQALAELLKGRTSFVVAHRLSTIRNADRVLMVKDGQIIESGTHQSLLDQRGAYYELYMSQFQRQEQAAGLTAAETGVPSAAGLSPLST
jgi:ATP-binding cassette subfamily B protein